MIINPVALALLAVVGLPAAGFAATMSGASNGPAMIYSHDASSRFLNGSYIPGQRLSDDGFPDVSALVTNSSSNTVPAPGAGASRSGGAATTEPSANPAPASGAETSQSGGAAAQAASLYSASSLADTIGNASRVALSGQNNITGAAGVDVDDPIGSLPVSHVSTVPLPASSALFGVALLILAGLGHGLRGRASQRA